jgi:hypothetical protein
MHRRESRLVASCVGQVLETHVNLFAGIKLDGNA